MKVKKISAANVEAFALPKLFDEEKIDFQPFNALIGLHILTNLK